MGGEFSQALSGELDSQSDLGMQQVSQKRGQQLTQKKGQEVFKLVSNVVNVLVLIISYSRPALRINYF